MSSILVHATHGPESPTRAALALLVARAALTEGHQVSLFLAGDAGNGLFRQAAIAAINAGHTRH
jgi:predicted peroxiredoxin